MKKGKGKSCWIVAETSLVSSDGNIKGVFSTKIAANEYVQAAAQGYCNCDTDRNRCTCEGTDDRQLIIFIAPFDQLWKHPSVGVCCFCGEDCNALSQACGRCIHNGAYPRIE